MGAKGIIWFAEDWAPYINVWRAGKAPVGYRVAVHRAVFQTSLSAVNMVKAVMWAGRLW